MIYFAKRHSDGLIKIGTSKDVQKRIYHLQRDVGENLEILATCEGSYTAERAIHEYLEEFRVDGEWFDDSPEVRAFIDSLDSFDPPSENNGPREIKLIIEEPYFSMLKDEAKKEGRSLRQHVRCVIERHISKPKKPVSKYVFNRSGDIWDGMRWVPYSQFHSE